MRVVVGCLNMSRSMAGATNTGALAERYVVTSILSATPVAILAIVDAVAGATTIASAQSPKSTWLFHWPVLAVKNSVITGLPLSVDKVTGEINSLALGVIITCTSAPAFTKRRVSTADL